MTCPICSNAAMRAEIDVCPISGAPGATLAHALRNLPAVPA